MGISSSRTELLGRTYRVLTKDELTFKVYNLCRSIIAKWCFPTEDPSKVTQIQINNFLDKVDFHSKKFSVNYNKYGNYSSKDRTFKIPYDFYLRGIFWYTERAGESVNIGKNMDQVLFDEALKTLYGDVAFCVNKLLIKISDENTYKYNKLDETNLSDGKESSLFQSILETYTKCKYGVILITSIPKGAESGHRTLVFIENVDNNLNIVYYDPHGSNERSWSNQTKIYDNLKHMFGELSKPYLSKFNIKNIKVNEYTKICLKGIQWYSQEIDIGMCQLFSSMWLYTTIKVILEASKSNVILPNIEQWIYLIDDYYISQFSLKQRYNVLLLFSSKLYNYYVQTLQEEKKSIAQELEGYNQDLLRNFEKELLEYEVPYEPRTSQEDKKEMDDYIFKLAQETIKIRREEEKKQFIAESLLPEKIIRESRKRKIEEEAKELQDEKYKEYKQFRQRIKEEQRREEPYYKSIRGLIPFERKKKIYDECSSSSDCLSGCCYYNDIDNTRYCLDKKSCQEQKE